MWISHTACAALILVVVTSAEARLQQPLAFTNAQIISPCEGRSWGLATILVRDSLIVALDSTHKVSIPPNTDVRDLRGAYVIPGLADSHFHAFQGSTTAPDETGRIRTDLQYLLASGITSIRDMAGDARMLQQLSEEERSGAAIPRIFFAALFAGVPFQDQRAAAASRGLPLGQAPWMRAVSDTMDIRSAVDAAKRTGATGIKLYASIPAEILVELAAEAKQQGLRVWSHARVRPLQAGHVAVTGVETMSHAHHFLDELEPGWNVRLREAALRGEVVSLRSARLAALFDTMAARNVMFDPTLSLYEFEQTGRLLAAGAIVNVARESGVRMLAGTDPMPDESSRQRRSGSERVPLVHREIELLVQYGGLSAMQALRAATCHAADAVGMGTRLGYLRVGYLADFVVLGSSPIESIAHIRDTRLVIKNGRIVGEW